eukprot:CAMPEP_0194439588 /NCGR_PEP_ID=MMETSP0176-20130528/111333_1 /TAXON_ID=216777 /ORGANISM="Proboscia alata, Strain PI-D3" /LENGTH=152 /DNA_ID=CAMNT_0039262943 /DNA_START=59 /DNA_END=514 /DNA_ORIENTATION=-
MNRNAASITVASRPQSPSRSDAAKRLAMRNKARRWLKNPTSPTTAALASNTNLNGDSDPSKPSSAQPQPNTVRENGVVRGGDVIASRVRSPPPFRSGTSHTSGPSSARSDSNNALRNAANKYRPASPGNGRVGRFGPASPNKYRPQPPENIN